MRKRVAVLLAMVVLAAGLVAGCEARVVAVAEQGMPVQDTYITAYQFGFLPDRIYVKAYQPVKLVFTSADVFHGVRIEGLDMAPTISGRSVIYRFTPTRPGTFEFYCDTTCGMQHDQMKGTLVVE